jgi:uncharacterized membrane protein
LLKQITKAGMNTFGYGEAFDERHFLMDHFKDDKDIAIDYMPTPYIGNNFPRTMEEISVYDVVLLSDVGTDTLLVYPDRFKIPMGPNRLHLIAEYVKNGGGFAAVGGWMSFGGQMGQAKYHNTILEDVLGIDASPYDDRVEVPEGFVFSSVKKGHALTDGMEWEKAPLLFLGYNRFSARQEADVLAEYDGDPMIVVNKYGKGRALSFASDLAPHWGGGFVKWENYKKFWRTGFEWLAGEI